MQGNYIYYIYIYIYEKSCIYIEFIIDIFSGIINRYTDDEMI